MEETGVKEKAAQSSSIYEPYDEKVFVEGLALPQLREYAKTLPLRTIWSKRVNKGLVSKLVNARIAELEKGDKNV